jgi:TPR repeat protein
MGRGARVDQGEALRWYWAAAMQGNAFAYYCLGRAYQNGQGMVEDDVEALKWFILAEENGATKLRLAASQRRSGLSGELLSVSVDHAPALAAS